MMHYIIENGVLTCNIRFAALRNVSPHYLGATDPPRAHGTEGPDVEVSVGRKAPCWILSVVEVRVLWKAMDSLQS